MRIRRSKEEIAKVVEEYWSSGMSKAEFCRRSGVPLGTLNNYCRRQASRGLVRIELNQQHGSAGSMAVVLGKGRRVEVGADFDDATLMRLIRVVEAA